MILSIMLPVFNQEDLLLTALNSIPLREDIELLIIDDCSTDATHEILVEWTKKNTPSFGGITLKTNEKNMGCGYSKNWAYSVARGKYIITLDSDDYFYTKEFSDAVDLLYSHDDDLIFVDNKVNNGEVWTDETKKATWSYFIKNDFLKEHSLNYDPFARRAGDETLTSQILERNPTKYHINKTVYHYNYPRTGSIVWLHSQNLKREREIEAWYLSRTGSTIDLQNPRTFTEKINWLKAHDSTKLKSDFADKFKAKELICEVLQDKSCVAPLLGVWDTFDDIDFSTLPDKFVLKVNSGCGFNLIVKDKSKLNMKEAKDTINKWLATDYSSLSYEYHYKNIEPKIIAEQYIELDKFVEYKFFCFNGDPKAVRVIIMNKETGKKEELRLDMSFNNTDIIYSAYKDYEGKSFTPPKSFNKMVEYSKKLSSKFCFVRVDFYATDETVYVGEMTFTPGAGASKWRDKSLDLKAGSLLDLRGIL